MMMMYFNSFHFLVHSPPFPAPYISIDFVGTTHGMATAEQIGNCRARGWEFDTVHSASMSGVGSSILYSALIIIGGVLLLLLFCPSSTPHLVYALYAFIFKYVPSLGWAECGSPNVAGLWPLSSNLVYLLH